eukprot:3935818-Rhodomonas_salina.1
MSEGEFEGRSEGDRGSETKMGDEQGRPWREAPWEGGTLGGREQVRRGVAQGPQRQGAEQSFEHASPFTAGCPPTSDIHQHTAAAKAGTLLARASRDPSPV